MILRVRYVVCVKLIVTAVYLGWDTLERVIFYSQWGFPDQIKDLKND